MGVIGIIFEARPNVTSDAAALCLKAGSAVILRGGKEAINSNLAVSEIMRNAVESVGFQRIVSHLLRIHQDRAQQSLCSYPIILMCLFPVAAQDLFVPLSKTQSTCNRNRCRQLPYLC